MKKNEILMTIILSFWLIEEVVTVTFSGKTPTFAYPIPVTAGQVVQAVANWNISATDVDLHLYQPGKVISHATDDACDCSWGGFSQTTTLTANANGNLVVWANQFSGAGVSLSITIKVNGAVVLTDSGIMHANASYFQLPVVNPACGLVQTIFTSAGSFNVALFSAGTALTGSPIQSVSYTGGSGPQTYFFPVSSSGTHDLRIRQNPVPTSGWSSFTTYTGEMVCHACNQFIVGCTQCSSKTVCTSCVSTFTLSSGNCVCHVANCQKCQQDGLNCNTCDSGFYVNGAGGCSPCSVMTDCLQCTSATFCTLCDGANFFNTTLGQCRPCYEAMPSCVDCDTQTVCLACTVDKYFDGTNCVLCSSAITSCLQCNVGTTCQVCGVGTFLNSTLKCQTCSSAMPGCLQCSSGSVCTKCDTSNILVNPSCQSCNLFISQCLTCQQVSPVVECRSCVVGYFVDPLKRCTICSAGVSNCKQCISDTQCTLCHSLHYLAAPNSCSTCINALDYCLDCSNSGLECYSCIDNRYQVENNKCYPCSKWLSNCTRCSSQTVCSLCESKYHLFNNASSGNIICKLCQTSMEGCETCLTATWCLTVVNDFYFIYRNNGSCVKCQVELPHCERCSGQQQCLKCEDGYFLENGQCILCKSVIDYCTRCRNRISCDVCQAEYQPYLPAGNCTCITGWYVPSYCTQQYGCTHAIKQNSLSVCLMCASDQHFVYNPTNRTCFCDKGYVLSQGTCVEKCGDGTHFSHQCDDKNLLSNDGCSEQCSVQEGWICLGEEYEVSKCYVDIRPEVKYLFTVRQDGQNKARHFFSIEPQSDLHKFVNFTDMLQINDPNIKVLGHYYERGRVEIYFSFSEAYISSSISYKWQLSKSFISPKVASTGFTTTPLSPSLDILEHHSYFSVVFWIGQVLAYLLLLLLIIGMFIHKLVAIELILVYQIIYATGILSVEGNQSIYRILTALRPALGIFDVFEVSRIDLVTPQILRFWALGRSLLYSLNISLGVFITAAIVYIAFYLFALNKKYKLRQFNQQTIKLQNKIAKKPSEKKSKLIAQIQEQKLKLQDDIFHSNSRAQLVNQSVFFPIIIGLLLPLIIMQSVKIIGSIKGQKKNIQNISSVMGLVAVLIGIMTVMLQVRKGFGSGWKESETKLPFRSYSEALDTKLIYKYGIALILYPFSVLMVTIVGIQTNIITGIIYSLSASSLYILLLIIFPPYTQPYHNRVIIFSNSIFLFHTIILLVDRYMKLSQVLLLTLILIIFVAGYISIILSLYRLYLQHKLMEKYKKPLAPGQQRKDIRQLIKLNPYNFEEDVRKDMQFKPDYKLGHHYDLIDGQEDDELFKIKKKLRKQITYMKAEDS